MLQAAAERQCQEAIFLIDQQKAQLLFRPPGITPNDILAETKRRLPWLGLQKTELTQKAPLFTLAVEAGQQIDNTKVAFIGAGVSFWKKDGAPAGQINLGV